MSEFLQNTQRAEPTYTYIVAETESSAVEQLLFRLFEQVTTDNQETNS